MQHICILIQTPHSGFRFGYVCSEALSSSLELHPGGLNYSFALQRHTGQIALIQVLTLGHMRLNSPISRQFVHFTSWRIRTTSLVQIHLILAELPIRMSLYE